MLVPVPFEVDVRNYLYLLDEQGADVNALKARLDALEPRVPKPERSSNADWQRLAADVYAAVIAFAPSADEPDSLEAIRATRPASRRDKYDAALPAAVVRDRIAGAWYGRIAGCVMGKPVECLMKHLDSRAQLQRILRESGEYPIRDFISEKTMVPYWTAEGTLPGWFAHGRGNDSLREYITVGPADDDLNYTVLSLDLLKRKGRGFRPDDVLDLWIDKLSYHAVCTAEHMAYRNRVMGLGYPEVATFMNPYCEWIGAQIRTDLYGYVCPGRPGEAAGMAWADAACSHVRNGLYGAMWVSAAIAAAFVERDARSVILRGLEQVPATSRFARQIHITVEDALRNGTDYEKTLDAIWGRLGNYHCVHTINNACVVAAASCMGVPTLVK